jgi:hypothetical protein
MVFVMVQVLLRVNASGQILLRVRLKLITALIKVRSITAEQLVLCYYVRINNRIFMFRAVFWVVLPCKMIVDRRFRGAYCLHHQG